ncbi:hypothetical protein, conserved [Babesia bigemina]|uniref:C3H1-type domain-containing protein n=1 Tax=Babesia bigemina TaxID=5866 RepID=A0A061BJL9_BABBI|nr:hypothetical protein, conserved [Babesia bigemina]CDR71661.1 hypothetical protein, conserved [Babesia bigemina]|eukprot:XP_012770608.1 hypothetical protein, conserved [Babesia bigemina]
MGFLSGVLKDVSEKQPYSVGKNDLKHFVETELKTKLSTGREGFKVIEQVARKVREYNDKVKTSNEKVKNIINEMKNSVGETLTKKMHAINNDHPVETDVTAAEALANEYASKGTDFINGFRVRKDFNIKQGAKYDDIDEFKDLNPDVQQKITNAIQNISYEATRLGALSAKEISNFDEMTAKIKDTFSSLKRCVNDQIGLKVHALVSELVKIINNIWNSLNEIADTLRQYITELVEWIIEADKIMTEAIKGAREIEQKNPGWREQLTIEGKANELKNKGEQLYQKFESAKQKVENNVKAALGKVKEMDGKLKEDLYKVKQAVDAQVAEIKNKIGQMYKQIDPSVNQVTADNKQKIDTLMKHIKSKIGVIAGSGVRVTKGLDIIKKTIKTYVRAFRESLGGKVEEWLTDIIKKEPVKWYISKYALNNKNIIHQEYRNATDDDDVYSQLATKIASVIKGQFESEVNGNMIRKAVEDVASNQNANIENNLQDIKTICTSFADALDRKLKNSALKGSQVQNPEITSFIKSIASTIEKALRESDYDSSTAIPDFYLISGLHSILPSLAASARHLAKEVDSLALQPNGNSIGKQLDDAASTANELYGRFETVLGLPPDPDREKPNHAKAVDTAIEGVTAELAKKLKPGDANAVKLDKDDTFRQYNGFVEQDNLAALTNPDFNIIKSAGSLPAAIGVIREKMVKDLDEACKETKNATVFDTLSKEIKNSLNALVNAFAEAGEEVKKKLVTFNNTKIGKTAHGVEAASDTLQKLQKNLLDLLTGKLEPLIKLANKCIRSDADVFKKRCIDSLTQHVNTESQEAVDKLITQARKLCISSMKSSLEQFSGKVTEELKPLPTLIDTDRRHGFKGFMRTLEGTIGDDGGTTDENIARLKGLVGQLSGHVKHKDTFQNLSQKFKQFWHPLHDYLKEETKRVHAANNEKTNPEPTGEEPLYTSKLDAANTALNSLLDHISNHRYNHEVPFMLDQLSAAIATLAPESFARTTTPLLDGISKGLGKFAAELGKAYISAYDSETFGGEMFEKQKLTPYGAKFAKICFTVVCTLKATLTDLTHNCKSLRGQQINKSTDVGRSFVAHGYAVSDATLQNGELQNKPTVAGENVAKRLLLPIRGANENQHLRWCESNKQRKADHFHVFDAIDCIFSHFEQYNELCHLLTASAKQHPCSVYDILIWLSGFPYTAVYASMRDITISDLFDNPHKKAAGDDELELTSTDMAAQSITAHPRNISYTYVRKAVDHICATSYDVLTAVVGTGDSRTVYASDFCNNSFNFHYPSDPSDCLDMLLDLLRRLLPVFRFLELQCNIKPEHHGWSHCRYGRDIPTTKSQCNEHSSEEPNGQAKCQVNCQATSPLMLYLSDSLPGHLPHQLQSVGCRAKCSTCSKSAPGQPCLLPLGFKGFSGSSKTGRQLRDVINTFLSTGLISSLMCLLPKPPSTLPEHFQFVFTLVGAFNASRDGNSNAVNAAFVKAIKKQSIDLYAEPSELTGALSDAYRSSQSHEGRNHPRPTEADLSSLSKTESCKYASTDDVHCAPYLTTLHSDAYQYAAEKHAGLYLSWAVYLPWSFWQCLESLFRAFTNISCQDWGCRRCTHGTACKRGKHGAAYNCQCKGLVECRGVISTLYSFGFTFGNPEKLLDAEGRRYCHNFYKQLNNVLNSNYFRTLFEKCDEFIFTIRQPFIWLNVALWSLSLFYLICVMVGRLDVLHIKSHLRSPSSHKITAQSLLAAAQVGRLAKISYLQP